MGLGRQSYSLHVALGFFTYGRSGVKHCYTTILIGNYFVEEVRQNPRDRRRGDWTDLYAPLYAPGDGEDNDLGPILLRNWMVLPVDTPGNSC